VEREAALELLNATHEFPCAFTIKVIGLAKDDLEQRVVKVLQDALHCDDIPYTTRETPKKKHIAVTLEPMLKSAEQVLLLYERIRSVEGVVMTM